LARLKVNFISAISKFCTVIHKQNEPGDENIFYSEDIKTQLEALIINDADAKKFLDKNAEIIFVDEQLAHNSIIIEAMSDSNDLTDALDPE